VSVVAGARISIRPYDRISSAQANYIRQLAGEAPRDLALSDRSVGRFARVNVRPLRVPAYVSQYRLDIHLSLSLSLSFPVPSSRGSYLRVTLRLAGYVCVEDVRVSKTTFTPVVETVNTSLTVIAILDSLEHTSLVFLSRLTESYEFAKHDALQFPILIPLDRLLTSNCYD